jgi:hypothetical protein
MMLPEVGLNYYRRLAAGAAKAGDLRATVVNHLVGTGLSFADSGGGIAYAPRD